MHLHRPAPWRRPTRADCRAGGRPARRARAAPAARVYMHQLKRNSGRNWLGAQTNWRGLGGRRSWVLRARRPLPVADWRLAVGAPSTRAHWPRRAQLPFPFKATELTAGANDLGRARRRTWGSCALWVRFHVRSWLALIKQKSARPDVADSRVLTYAADRRRLADGPIGRPPVGRRRTELDHRATPTMSISARAWPNKGSANSSADKII